jgi:hypothetical protein
MVELFLDDIQMILLSIEYLMFIAALIVATISLKIEVAHIPCFFTIPVEKFVIGRYVFPSIHWTISLLSWFVKCIRRADDEEDNRLFLLMK